MTTKAIEYFNGDELAANVWASKYALRDAQGHPVEETPADTHRRLAKEFARVEKKYPNPLTEGEIYSLLSDWYIVPQGSPMSAIGNTYQIQSLSNCFVVNSPSDSYGGITLTDQELAQIMKRRGGVGVDISSIRPRGMRTSNAAGSTDGIGVFMERFSNTTREVAQGGRRGALMISISCQHPDIETFINIKKDKTKVTGANVSVRVSDAFMKAVRDDSDFTLQWPVEAPVEEAKVTRVVKARDIWNQLVSSNWESAEPGILFWDTLINNSMSDLFADAGYKTQSTNPCGELPLNPHDSCRLALVNLTKFVKNPFTSEAYFDYELFHDVCRKAQRLMDDLVDLEIEAVDRIITKVEADPEPEHVKAVELNLWKNIRKTASEGRRTGLGPTGLGDMIAMLGVVYGSDKCVELTESVYKAMALAAHEESVKLGLERGIFPACAPSVYSSVLETGTNPFLTRLCTESPDEVTKTFLSHGRRNIALTTTAPAGSMSIMTQTTSGCEPVFMLSYTRRKKVNPSDPDARVDFIDQLGDKWTEFTVYHHGLKKWMEVTGETDATKSPYHGATANGIDWLKSVEIQAAAQRWVEHAISKTCNLPSTVTKEQVSDLYMKAWESGCKGFTIYRDGSRSGVLVDNKKKEPVKDREAPKRPLVLPCDIHRTNIKGEPYVMLVGLLDGKPYEVFCGLSKNLALPKSRVAGSIRKDVVKDSQAVYSLLIPVGTDGESLEIGNIVDMFDNPLYGAFTRTISLSLRHGVPVKFIVEQLRKDKHSDMTSFASAVARVLAKHYITDGEKVTGSKKCSDCGGSNVSYLSGCATCMDCGGSKCS